MVNDNLPEDERLKYLKFSSSVGGGVPVGGGGR